MTDELPKRRIQVTGECERNELQNQYGPKTKGKFLTHFSDDDPNLMSPEVDFSQILKFVQDILKYSSSPRGDGRHEEPGVDEIIVSAGPERN
jgi:hypothetical protein